MLTLAPAGQEMQPTPPPASRAQEVLQQAHTHMKQGNAQQALATLDQAIALQPDFFEALNDKAWILATHPDPKVRNPDQALELAKRALDSMASAGMLRKNRDAFADQHSTGRMIIVMSTVAAALAAQGHFSTAQTNPGEPTSRASTQLRSSGGCGAGGDAMAVQTYVVQAARELHTRFNTPSTGQALQQSQRLLELYRAGKPPVGENQVASSTSPLTKLR